MVVDIKFIGVAAALTAGLLVAGAGDALAARCTVILGASENPPVVSDGTGRFRIVAAGGDALAYRLTYDLGDAEVTQAHIHIANPGNNGGIAAFLCTNIGGGDAPACPTPSGTVNDEIGTEDVLEVTEDATTIIAAGDLDGFFKLVRDGATYVNIHTTDHELGEIRCQINARIR